MMGFEWLKFVHVVTIIATVTLAEGTILGILLAARRREVRTLRALLQVSEVSDRAANPLLVISLLFGVLAALAGQISLTASWLVVTYVLIVVGFGAIGLGGGFRHLERLKRAAESSPPDQPSHELTRLLDHPWSGAVTVLPPVLMGTIVFLMVMKPDLW
ncbi:MAG: DUF2269 family protein [Chloroflexi bacterium]|nr:DUF2269 family protein [Chloroflexota bacterium]